MWLFRASWHRQAHLTHTYMESVLLAFVIVPDPVSFWIILPLCFLVLFSSAPLSHLWCVISPVSGLTNLIKMLQNVLEESEGFLQSQEAPAANPKSSYLCGYLCSKTAGRANSAKTNCLLNSAIEWESVDFSEVFQWWCGQGRGKQQWWDFGFWLMFEIALIKKKSNPIV